MHFLQNISKRQYSQVILFQVSISNQSSLRKIESPGSLKYIFPSSFWYLSLVRMCSSQSGQNRAFMRSQYSIKFGKCSENDRNLDLMIFLTNMAIRTHRLTMRVFYEYMYCKFVIIFWKLYFIRNVHEETIIEGIYTKL